MESGHGSRASGDLRTHPDTILGEGDLSTQHKKLDSSSSASSLTSESSSEDPFKLDENEIHMSTTGTIAPTKVDNNFRLASANSEEDIPVSPMPVQGQSSHGSAGSSSPPPTPISSTSATQSPPMQVMDRAGEPTPSEYRIPSSVFDRTKSTAAPMEWSTASNESLFSIHMGNMSFTRDHVFWLGKSGELGKPGELSMSNPLIDMSSNQPPIAKKSVNLDEGVGASEAAIETMREVIRENAEDSSKEKLAPPARVLHSGSFPRRSDVSGASTKSFAFPILTGDGEKSGSLKVLGEKHKQQPQSPKPQSSKTQSLNLGTPKSQTPKAAPNAAQTRWFSCFSCCPFCT